MERFRNQLAEKLLSLNLVKSSDLPVLNYGLDVLISSVINIITVLCCSLICNTIWHGIIFLIMFIPLRMTLGGYHAQTRLRCFMVGVILYFFVSLLHYGILYVFSDFWVKIILLIMLAINTTYLLLAKPARNPNHPIREEKLRRNKILSLKFTTAESVFSLIGLSVPPTDSPIDFSTLALSAVVILHLITHKGGDTHVRS